MYKFVIYYPWFFQESFPISMYREICNIRDITSISLKAVDKFIRKREVTCEIDVLEISNVNTCRPPPRWYRRAGWWKLRLCGATRAKSRRPAIKPIANGDTVYRKSRIDTLMQQIGTSSNNTPIAALVFNCSPDR